MFRRIQDILYQAVCRLDQYYGTMYTSNSTENIQKQIGHLFNQVGDASENLKQAIREISTATKLLSERCEQHEKDLITLKLQHGQARDVIEKYCK